MTEFERLIDELSALVEDAFERPLHKGQIVVEREEVLRIINGLSTHYPTELARANSLLEERERILLKAKTDATRMEKEAQEKRDALLNEQEIVVEAKRTAEETLAHANAEAERVRNTAYEIADNMLRSVEEHYDHNLAYIKKARRVIRENM